MYGEAAYYTVLSYIHNFLILYLISNRFCPSIPASKTEHISFYSASYCSACAYADSIVADTFCGYYVFPQSTHRRARAPTHACPFDFRDLINSRKAKRQSDGAGYEPGRYSSNMYVSYERR